MNISRAAAIAVLSAAVFSFACDKGERERPPKPSEAISTDIAPKPEKPAESPAQRAHRAHFDSLVFDTHADTLMRVVDDKEDLGVRSDKGHIDFVRMKEGGLDAQVFAAWVAPEYWPDKAKKRALEMIDALHASIAAHPDIAGFASTVEEAERLVAQGKIAAFAGIEGGHAIEDDVGALKMFWDKGVRYMTLTWWMNTNWADGSGDKPKSNGLSDLGRKVVAEMNRLGMIVDVSHVSEKTFRDVLEVARKPVIASHSNTRAVVDHHRNLSDDMLKALAKNGGVVGINYVSEFLDPAYVAASNKLEEKLKPEMDAIEKKYKNDPMLAHKEQWKYYEEKAKDLPPVMLDRVIDHIDHAVKIAGVDHVGLGSDFDGFHAGAKELTDCTKLPLITEKLLERGYTEEDVAKILGKNFLRVFKENIGR